MSDKFVRDYLLGWAMLYGTKWVHGNDIDDEYDTQFLQKDVYKATGFAIDMGYVEFDNAMDIKTTYWRITPAGVKYAQGE